MKKIKILDKEFQLFLSSRQIAKSIKRLSTKINKDYEGKHPIFLSILNGAFIFSSELFKNINLDCEISFLKLSSYKGIASTGKIKELIGLEIDLSNKDVIILEDIVDSGNTIENIYKSIEKYNPASIRVSTLLLKPDTYKKDIAIDYVGFEIPDNFVVGFGMDYNGIGRNVNEIYCII